MSDDINVCKVQAGDYVMCISCSGNHEWFTPCEAYEVYFNGDTITGEHVVIIAHNRMQDINTSYGGFVFNLEKLEKNGTIARFDINSPVEKKHLFLLHLQGKAHNNKR